MNDLIERQTVLDAIEKIEDEVIEGSGFQYEKWKQFFMDLSSAQLDMAEKLYLYKCYITDKDGLQHEVIHTGDIRRVTGWEM